jgi:hypothetical protein
MRVHLGKDAITGKMIQPSRRFHGSRLAAERELSRFRAELEEAGPRPLAMSSRVTLNEVVERHLAASDQLAPGTRRTYQSQYDRHIAPGLGRSPAAKLTAQGMRTYYRRLAEESELSDSSIWSIYSLISSRGTEPPRGHAHGRLPLAGAGRQRPRPQPSHRRARRTRRRHRHADRPLTIASRTPQCRRHSGLHRRLRHLGQSGWHADLGSIFEA